MGIFELKSSGTQFHFVLKGGNGEPILSSERYTTKQGAVNGIAAVRINAPLDVRYVRKATFNGQYMFNLKGGNNEVIGTSETYTSVASRDNGIESVKTNAPTARVVDLT